LAVKPSATTSFWQASLRGSLSPVTAISMLSSWSPPVAVVTWALVTIWTEGPKKP
jgi:hypothetical protein